MPVIKCDALTPGDVLSVDVVVNDVSLFDAGTVMAAKHIALLNMLGVEAVDIEPRRKRTFGTLDDVFVNIDSRFSFVEDDRFMMSLKHLVKDIVTTTGRLS